MVTAPSDQASRVVVAGAGGSVVEALSANGAAGWVLGLARRGPSWSCPKLERGCADLPARHPVATWRTNASSGERHLDGFVPRRAFLFTCECAGGGV